MNFKNLLLGGCCLVSSLVLAAETDSAIGDPVQHDVIGVKETKARFTRTTHPDAQWFKDAGLGLFVHWGIASSHGGLDLSWGMMAGKTWGPAEKPGETLVSPAEYFGLADRFKPTKFDPDRFLASAKQAGFRYAVMTTKHHDGYTLWPSGAGDYGVQHYMPGRDFVREFVGACRKNDLKVGLYYSPPDWHFNRDFMSFRIAGKDSAAPRYVDWHHEPMDSVPTPSTEHTAAYHAYLKQQIVELLTRYGKIDVLWFDGRPEVISVEEIRALQPGIVLNSRMHGRGDFTTPEGRLPQARIEGWWELCDSWSVGWGYTHDHENYKSTGWMLERFTRVRGWSGNYLLNAAPRADGTMPDSYYQRMVELADWMKENREAVFDVSPGPFPESCNVPVTVKGQAWFVLVPPTFKLPVVLTGIERPIRTVMIHSKKQLGGVYRDGVLTIDIPVAERTSKVDVIRIEWPAGSIIKRVAIGPENESKMSL